MNIYSKILLSAFVFFFANIIYAEAPIEDQSTDASSLTLEQRVIRLEHQVNNLNHQNFQSHLDTLEQQVQKLNGDIEVQTQDIKDLKNEVNNFYKDLDQRIKQKSPAEQPDTANDTTANAKTLDSSNSTKSASKSSTTPKDTTPEEQKLYQSALDLLQEQKFDAGALKLRTYLKNYPDGTFVANAHYWLGEVYFTEQKNKQAEAEFSVITSKYKTFKKYPDALLKIALIHDKTGKHDQAKKEFNNIKKKFPKTNAAKLAEEQLKNN
jgi:tol-pal system protein YbgF